MYRIAFLCAGAFAGTLMVIFTDTGSRDTPVYLSTIDPLTLPTQAEYPVVQQAEVAEPSALPIAQAALVQERVETPVLVPEVVEIATRATADPFDALTLLPNPVEEHKDPLPLLQDDVEVTQAAFEGQDFEATEQAMLARMEQLKTAPILTTHVVKRGESLTAISDKYYGNFTGYVYIFEANRSALTSPEALAVGMELTIPDLDAL